MYHIGVDIVEIARIKKAIARWGDSFLRRVYTESELEVCSDRLSSLAARFVGKEAAIKALKQTSGISWHHIEVLSEANGRPVIRLRGQAQEQARRLGLSDLSISLSHSKEYAIAIVAGETIGPSPNDTEAPR